MRRPLFFIGIVTAMISSSLGQYTGYSQGYGYGQYQQAPAYQQPQSYQQPQYSQQYYGYPPAYQQSPEPSVDASRRPYPGTQPAGYEQSMLPSAEQYKNSAIEIWLSEGVGRWGDYWFRALGGTSKNPTPKGTFSVKVKHNDFYSNKYDAPMPRSVFFTEQCAIHVGSLKVKSHGCIHVDWPTGQLIYENSKVGKTRVKIHP